MTIVSVLVPVPLICKEKYFWQYYSARWQDIECFVPQQMMCDLIPAVCTAGWKAAHQRVEAVPWCYPVQISTSDTTSLWQ